MKAFKELLRDASGVEFAMAFAIAITFAVIAAGAHFGFTSVSGEQPCCGPNGFHDYRGPRA